MELLKLIMRLYSLVSRLDVYVYFCYPKKKPDINTLKEEIKGIKQVISEIEVNIDRLS